ncbi:hypothetical protein [Bifidobacterium parmae]|uniref:Cell surface protein n=1 Tax=Bifidobacterium parmae TaxID=361854 RepID=A0A2N5J0H9_9BIFI|nr:hypothetical protein [Bifidobacterium parmae]PLS27715.1 hypothetical protein Uis4E_1401 [Bifidobacterium parmae]
MRFTQKKGSAARPLVAALAATATLGVFAVAGPAAPAQAAGFDASTAPACNTISGATATVCSTTSGNTEAETLRKALADASVTTVYFKDTADAGTFGVHNDYIDFSDSADNATVTIDHPVAFVGARTQELGTEPATVSRITDIEFHVVSGGDLTLAGNLVVDDDETKLIQGRSETPVTVDGNGKVTVQDTARLISNGGVGSEKGYGVHVLDSAVGAQVNLQSEGTYDRPSGVDGASGLYPTVYGSSAAVFNASTNATVTISGNGSYVAENNNEDSKGQPSHAVITYGELNVTGSAQVASIHQYYGTTTISGTPTIDTAIADDFDEQPESAQYPLRADAGTVYLTGGTIADRTKSTDVPAAVDLTGGAQLAVQAAKPGAVDIDGTQPYIGKAYGDDNGFTTDPTVSVDFTELPGVTVDGKTTLQANPSVTSDADLATLAAADKDAKPAKNTSVAENGPKLTSTYLGYHGDLTLYGRYPLFDRNAGILPNIFDENSTGTATVYGTPVTTDYEWFAQSEVENFRKTKTYPTKDTELGYGNRVFGGWFDSYDDWNTNASPDGKVTYANGFAWAHAAYAKNQNVGVQVAGTRGNGKTLAVRFLTTVDSRKYTDVRFRIVVKNGNQTLHGTFTTTKAYDYVTANGQRLTPKGASDTFGAFDGPQTEALDNGAAQAGYAPGNGYFATSVLTGVPDSWFGNGGNTITITPQWTTLDGTVVTGTPVVKTAPLNQ